MVRTVSDCIILHWAQISRCILDLIRKRCTIKYQQQNTCGSEPARILLADISGVTVLQAMIWMEAARWNKKPQRCLLINNTQKSKCLCKEVVWSALRSASSLVITAALTWSQMWSPASVLQLCDAGLTPRCSLACPPETVASFVSTASISCWSVYWKPLKRPAGFVSLIATSANISTWGSERSRCSARTARNFPLKRKMTFNLMCK